MQVKTITMLAYIAKNYSPVTITGLLKLSYLIDLTFYQRNKKQISNFEYCRYTYGPFDKKIYEYIGKLVERKILFAKTEYVNMSLEYTKYEFNKDFKIDLGSLKPNEMRTINKVLNSLGGCGAKALTLISYKTRPMLELGATLGGNEKLGARLNMGAV